MFDYLTGWTLAYLIVGISIVVLCRVWLRNSWKRVVEADDFDELRYKGESFRSPLNLSIAIVAILVPVAAGIAAYHVDQDPNSAIDPLAVAILALLVALLWGAWQSYSIATQSPNDDTMTITRKRNWLVPVDFAIHLVVLLVGVSYLVIFLLFYFEPGSRVGDLGAEPVQESAYVVVRPKPALGMTSERVRQLWGSPAQTDLQADVVVYQYDSPTSVYILTFEDGKLVTIQEELK